MNPKYAGLYRKKWSACIKNYAFWITGRGNKMLIIERGVQI